MAKCVWPHSLNTFKGRERLINNGANSALINPLSHDGWPEPTEEEIERINAEAEHVSAQVTHTEEG